MNVHVASTGIGRFGKRSEPLPELLAEAGEEALRTIGRKSIDLLVIGSMSAGLLGATENLVPRVADRLGLDAVAGLRVESASASGAAAVHAAALALATGPYRRALVISGEKMTGRPTSEVAEALARSLAPSEIAVGATMPALAALVAQRYLDRYHLDETALDAVTVGGRAAGARNPNAQFQAAVTLQEVRASRPIAAPLRLLHCSAISDGAAAVVLEQGSGPAQLLGLGQSVDALSIVDRADLTTFRATRIAGERAFEMAKLSPSAVRVAEVHDAFAPFALIDLEDLGLAAPGEAAAGISTGRFGLSGPVPVNPSGGLLARGHPVGASGIVQIAEIARQLRREAGPMQIDPRPDVGVAQSIGGLASHNFVTVLGPGAPP